MKLTNEQKTERDLLRKNDVLYKTYQNSLYGGTPAWSMLSSECCQYISFNDTCLFEFEMFNGLYNVTIEK